MSKQQQQLAIPDVAVAANIDQETWNALVTSIYPGANPESVTLAFQYCKARKLDPLKKPVHIVPMSVRNAVTGRYEWRDVIMPGIQELRTTASRTGMMAGTDAPVFGREVEVPVTENPEVKDPDVLVVPESCSVTVHRLDKNGVPRAYTHIEFFEEAVARTREGAINSMWCKRSRGQLAKCAEAGALRKAFPEELGGILAAEEMEGKSLAPAGAPGHIEGDFTEVKGDDIPMPSEVTGAAKGGTDAPAAEPKAEPKASATKADPPPAASKYEVKGGDAPAGESKHAITLEPGPMRVLTSRLQNAGLTVDQLLTGFGKDVNIGNINEAFSWIKDQA